MGKERGKSDGAGIVRRVQRRRMQWLVAELASVMLYKKRRIRTRIYTQYFSTSARTLSRTWTVTESVQSFI